jgi:hypothetical protein
MILSMALSEQWLSGRTLCETWFFEQRSSWARACDAPFELVCERLLRRGSHYSMLGGVVALSLDRLPACSAA